MNMEILGPILTLSAIAIGAGIMLNEFGNDDKYDERQLIERGKAAGLAMNTAIVYLLGIFGGKALGLLRTEYMEVFAIWGLVVTMLVQTGYCIFHDAYLTAEKEALFEAPKYGALGGLLLAMALFNNRGGIDWVILALAVEDLGGAAMLLIYALVLHIRDRRSAKENADGEE